VTVFGSARFDEDHRYYALARETSARLAREGFTVVTGGGPGIMEAANRGALEAGGLSMGATIDIPTQEEPNEYLHACAQFDHFFVRKVMLVKYSLAFVVLPGGFGTMDEVFETATLIQTRKIESFPLVLMGTEFWDPVRGFMQDTMVAMGTIRQADVDRFVVTDDPAVAVARAVDSAVAVLGTDWREHVGRRTVPRQTLAERGLRCAGSVGLPPE
jgi:hypothetical protein